MSNEFQGWEIVAQHLRERSLEIANAVQGSGHSNVRLNTGQRASIEAIAARITKNGVIIADEVGMGKTRIAVEVARSVVRASGRVAILVPPGLGFQWDSELSQGDLEAPLILRSLWQFLSVWREDRSDGEHPWFELPIVVVSHAFANWRLGSQSEPWRSALLPEVYALWRKHRDGRLPRGYVGNKYLEDEWVRSAAESICTMAAKNGHTEACKLLDKIVQNTPWPGAMEAGQYKRHEELRTLLEQAVGLGLGAFDLIIIDEAHKSRNYESKLSQLIKNVVLLSRDARTIGLTATPVELDVAQWHDILVRIGIEKAALKNIRKVIDKYSAAVTRVRQCLSDEAVREHFYNVAKEFKDTLDPYLLRRDKREDRAVQAYQQYTGTHEYRLESTISVNPEVLSTDWKSVVCAAEALSIVARQKEDPVAKRLRLTVANGHGLSTLIDETRDEASDNNGNTSRINNGDSPKSDPVTEMRRRKRLARGEWWRDVLIQRLGTSEQVLYSHPAIIAARNSIEDLLDKHEKVLVFGRFNRPLRALTESLNAREMIRYLMNPGGKNWPQSKIPDSSWPAVKAACDEMKFVACKLEIDERLERQYRVLEQRRRRSRAKLIESLEEGLAQLEGSRRALMLFTAFKSSAEQQPEDNENHPLAVMVRALSELLGSDLKSVTPKQIAESFIQLIGALDDSDTFEGESQDDLAEEEVSYLWKTLEERLTVDYSSPQGNLARFMYGDTKPHTRRMLQLGFNRDNGFPRVLIAQSVVGREGLNLHEACRFVVLLHPEWNPGVLEQQIGRVDRIGSHWEKQFFRAAESGTSTEEVPKIECRAVVFAGTYDEHNWRVLNERWDNLRAQLHGLIISARQEKLEHVTREWAENVNRNAPNFSPLRREPSA